MNENLIFWSPGLSLEELERLVIVRAMQYYRGNKTATAHSLKIAIRTLDNKLALYAEQEKAHQEIVAQDKLRQLEFDRRQRGNPTPYHMGLPYEPYTPPNVRTDHDEAFRQTRSALPNHPGDVLSTASRLRMESSSHVEEKPTVPVPERKEVQSVLPNEASKSGFKKGR